QGWADLIATLTALTARSIGDAYRRWVLPRGVDEVFLTGGGARNPALFRMIQAELDPIPVHPGEGLGIDPDAKEAVAFAALAWAHVHGLPGNVPEATGAAGPRVLGSYTPGARDPGPLRGSRGRLTQAGTCSPSHRSSSRRCAGRADRASATRSSGSRKPSALAGADSSSSAVTRPPSVS